MVKCHSCEKMTAVVLVKRKGCNYRDCCEHFICHNCLKLKEWFRRYDVIKNLLYTYPKSTEEIVKELKSW